MKTIVFYNEYNAGFKVHRKNFEAGINRESSYLSVRNLYLMFRDDLEERRTAKEPLPLLTQDEFWLLVEMNAFLSDNETTP